MTATSDQRILRQFRQQNEKHDNPHVVHEHGGTFVSCYACGALWSVQQNQHGDKLFEEMGYGDESCPTTRKH